MISTLARHKFSVEAYERMIESGFIREDERVELIRGEIIDKMPIGPGHSACLKRLIRILLERLGRSATVGVQDPIRLIDSEPEPDVSVVRPRSDDYATGHPQAADVHLLIEVADTSLEYDRVVKLALYAASNICEYWIVDLTAAQIEVYRNPRPDGSYALVTILKRGAELEPAAFPGVRLTVDEILPKV